MLELVDIRKVYRTGDLVQEALAGVTLNFRDSEFVAVLGPSGSGKTTLLNIIGGLDRYDEGDLIINGVSTKNYSDRDWNSYRNHKIGFVFQTYNLIPHQTILSNVELALTIAGVSREERRERAKKALEDVGLGDQLHKRPSELSGGQMQRVAIARALVNDPEILLADEPTGALDSETSKQVMELLKEVSQDRLVIMVTHNPDLADTYANRIVKLYDGVIIDDSNPFFVGGESIAEEAVLEDEIAKGEVPEEAIAPVREEKMGKASMSFWTAVSLSFNNMRTKKGRTILTAFAGSIGIIGIALIMSLSGGINQYIEDVQRETMTTYPISIEAQALDLEGLMSSADTMTETIRGDRHGNSDEEGVTTSSASLRMTNALSSSIAQNDLTEFKHYLDDPDSPIQQYIGENGIVYTYDTRFSVYAIDPNGEIINTDGSTFDSETSSSSSSFSLTSLFSGSSSSGGSEHFEQMMAGANGELVSPTVTDNYDLVYGSWPASYDEVVMFLNSNGQISVTTMYELGILPADEYREILARLDAGEEVNLSSQNVSYEDICNQTFYLVPACDEYVETDGGIFRSIGSTASELQTLLDGAIELKIVGIVQPDPDASVTNVSATIGYTGALTDYIIDYTDNSPVVQAQINNPDVNILNGVSFVADDAETYADTDSWLADLDTAAKADLLRTLIDTFAGNYSWIVDMFLGDSDEELAQMFDDYVNTASGMTYEVLEALFNVYMTGGSYDENMTAFGYVNLDAPIAIDIYVDTFEDKDGVTACIEEYNASVSEDYQIVYTDYLGMLLSSITTIIDMVSYILIAFVAVSLIVSSIMIGIITYISVLERTKEIGILRALGASKSNIALVFDAESLIIGLAAGLIGVLITLLLLLPINALIHSLAGTDIVSAVLPVSTAVILVLLSMLLTFIAGLIPSSNASRRDPVVALRTE